jgi:hypothetical protein
VHFKPRSRGSEAGTIIEGFTRFGLLRKTRGRVVRYSLLVRLLHPLLHAGLSRRTVNYFFGSLADEVGDLLAHGGHDDDVTRLIWAALSNKQRRIYAGFLHDDEKIDKDAEEAVRKDWKAVAAELRMEWKRNSAAKSEETTDAKVCTARIRALTVDTLRDRFKEYTPQWLAGGAPPFE